MSMEQHRRAAAHHLVGVVIVGACLLVAGCKEPPPLVRTPEGRKEYERRKERVKSVDPQVFSEHLVIVRWKRDQAEDPGIDERREIERKAGKLRDYIAGHGVGEYQGGNVVGEFAELYFFGADGDKLYKVLLSALREHEAPQGTHVIVRRGPLGTTEERHDMSEKG